MYFIKINYECDLLDILRKNVNINIMVYLWWKDNIGLNKCIYIEKSEKFE